MGKGDGEEGWRTCVGDGGGRTSVGIGNLYREWELGACTGFGNLEALLGLRGYVGIEAASSAVRLFGSMFGGGVLTCVF